MLVPLMNATFMARVTPRGPLMTTRKRHTPCCRSKLACAGPAWGDSTSSQASLLLQRLLPLAALLLTAGCSTPGPLHLYSTSERGETVHDRALQPDEAADTSGFTAPEETVTGFAYDPYTDHFFLLLAPGDRIRVVDRPARKIKREMPLREVGVNVAGDLAARPIDGHLFLLVPGQAVVVQTNRFGDHIRTHALSVPPPTAVAVDPERAVLWALRADGRTLDGLSLDSWEPMRTVTLAAAVAPSLAYDAVARELYAPLLADGGRPREVGVFNEAGALVRQLPLPKGDTLIDVGPHSFLRVF